MFYDTAEFVCSKYSGKDDFKEFELELIRVFGMESPVDEAKYNSSAPLSLTEDIYNAAMNRYDEKNSKIAELIFKDVSRYYDNPENRPKHIRAPFSDGRRGLEVSTTIQEAYESKGKSMIRSFEKSIVLGLIDNEWKEHLREMDDLKQSVQQARHEQKDPLLVYKLESYNLFRSMLDRLNQETVEFLVKGVVPFQQSPQSIANQAAQQQNSYAQAKEVTSSTSSTPPPQFAGSEGYDQAMANSQQQSAPKPQPAVAEKKINRNDPCPCGSGKKYKQCHGK
jgi:preprotein translocase subunit SecA